MCFVNTGAGLGIENVGNQYHNMSHTDEILQSQDRPY